jgi:hypothetical protein
MDDTPNYSFYRNPRFSANHLAEYLCTRDANQRDAVIRKAKFPRKPSVIAYQQVSPGIRAFLTKNSGDATDLDALAERLRAKAEREEGYNRDEALRCVAAIDAFKATWAKNKWGKVEFSPGPRDLVLKLEGVAVNIRLDPPISEKGSDERVFSGGCVILMASSPEARKNIEDRRKYVAALAHWGLEDSATNIEVLPKLCMSFDIFGNEVVRASSSHTRLRQTITASCREAASKWDAVEPPQGYDGPDWR